jgi:putative nucleotidyltransferase with HDIG domain
LHWLDEAFRATPVRTWHSRSVWHRAAAARRHELSWLSSDRMETLELAALLHDIGRALDPENTEPHGFVGARFLDAIGLHDVAPLVAHHSGAQHEAAERHMSHLDVWQSDAELLALLTYFDRTTSVSGESVTFHERRASTAQRYGVDSPQLRWFDESMPIARHGISLLQQRDVFRVA